LPNPSEEREIIMNEEVDILALYQEQAARLKSMVADSLKWRLQDVREHIKDDTTRGLGDEKDEVWLHLLRDAHADILREMKKVKERLGCV
jgi:hypothetical protein